MWVLAIKILGPVVLIAELMVDKSSELRDKRSRQRAMQSVVIRTIVYAVAAVGLIADHMSQAAETAAAQEAEARAQEAAASAEEQAHEARRDAETARQERQIIITQVNRVSNAVVGQTLNLSVVETLERVGEEYGALRDRADELEDELNGLRRYGEVSELGATGNPEMIGPGTGLRWDSPLVRALEGLWVDRNERLYPRCDQDSLDRFADIAGDEPDFPFTHYALAICGLEADDQAWREHANRALDILRYTTQIAGHNPSTVKLVKPYRDDWSGAASVYGIGPEEATRWTRARRS